MAAAPRSSFHGAAASMCLLLFFLLLASTTTTVTGSSSVSGVEKFNGSCIRRTGHVLKLDLHNDFFQDDFDDFWSAYHDEGHVANWLCGQVSSSLLANISTI
jgi:hypothetical protein